MNDVLFIISKADASPSQQAKALEKIGNNNNNNNNNNVTVLLIGDAVAAVKSEVIKPEPPDTTINTARLLVSCLHAWNLDQLLDKLE